MYFRENDWFSAFMFAVALAVAAIPEALKFHCDDCTFFWNTEDGKRACNHS